MNESHIVTRTYDLQLNGGKTVHLRLTVAAQLRLKNKFNEDALDVILSASSDPERPWLYWMRPCILTMIPTAI